MIFVDIDEKLRKEGENSQLGDGDAGKGDPDINENDEGLNEDEGGEQDEERATARFESIIKFTLR